MVLMDTSADRAVTEMVMNEVRDFATTFRIRHIAEKDDPDGTLNMKIHNAFIATLGSETQYYTSLVRSFDSSLGNMLERLAMRLAEVHYEVRRSVEGPLSPEQTQAIAALLEAYKSYTKKPQVSDYQVLRNTKSNAPICSKRHDSDYYLTDRQTKENSLIELKIGGDLDNKKARSEKEAILEQFAILSNTLPADAQIKIYFGTAYNRFGEDSPWTQSRVRQYFAEDELLIGREFWNFITKSENGYLLVMNAYRDSAHYIIEALDEIKALYLGS